MHDSQLSLEQLYQERGQLQPRAEMGDRAAQTRLLHVAACIRELEAAGRVGQRGQQTHGAVVESRPHGGQG